MSELTVHAKRLSGAVTLPPFKSEVIRALLLSALSGNEPTSVVRLPDCLSDDIKYGIKSANTLYNAIQGKAYPSFDVGESATLLRLLIPSTLALFGNARFKVDAALYRRGLAEYESSLGCKLRYENGELFLSGELSPKRYNISVSRSSQFVSGILLALPLIPGSSLALPLGLDGEPLMVSRPYFELTKTLMQDFGIEFFTHSEGMVQVIEAKGRYTSPASFIPEGDGSYAANFITANHLGSSISFLNPPSAHQADSMIGDLLLLRELDISDCPDLFPILCAAACARKETVTINGISRLRTKESDRVSSMLNGITAIGGKMTVLDDTVRIVGTGRLHGGKVDSCWDHRIVMAFTIASLICDEPITIVGAEAVSKSAPQFFRDFSKLGGYVCEHIR